MLFAGQVDKLGIQARQNTDTEINTLLRRSVLDDHEWLPRWVYCGTMQGMARDDFHVTGQILIKGGQLRGFTRSLTSNDGANFGRGAILGNNFVNELSLDTVNDPVAGPRDKVTIR